MENTPVEQSSSPSPLRNILYLFYGTLGIGIVRSVIGFDSIAEKAAPIGGSTFALITLSISMGFLWLNIYFIGLGKNWARWLFLILFVLGTPLSIKPLIDSFQNSPLSGILGLLQMVMQLLGIVLMFRSPASECFKKA